MASFFLFINHSIDRLIDWSVHHSIRFIFVCFCFCFCRTKQNKNRMPKMIWMFSRVFHLKFPLICVRFSERQNKTKLKKTLPNSHTHSSYPFCICIWTLTEWLLTRFSIGFFPEQPPPSPPLVCSSIKIFNNNPHWIVDVKNG